MLHTVNKSPTASNQLARCLRLAQPGDSILLIEDGVLAAQTNSTASQLLIPLIKQYSFYALLPDLQARGIADCLLNGIIGVDYPGFVELVEQHEKVLAWT